MKQPRKYENRARKYRILAKGYSALRSRLARPAEGAAETFERLASAAEVRDNWSNDATSTWCVTPCPVNLIVARPTL
jgi:hypothetical protein